MRDGQPPSALPHLAGQRARIMAERMALEPVEQHDQRRAGIFSPRAFVEKIDIDEIAVGRVPADAAPARCGQQPAAYRRIDGV